MFKCDECKRVSEPREKQHKIVTQRRNVKYANGSDCSVGWEIVRESKLCEDCHDKSPFKI